MTLKQSSTADAQRRAMNVSSLVQNIFAPTGQQ
jgi:hypothetical protein